MTTYQVVHIKQNGVDLVIVVVNSAFGTQSLQQQNEVIANLQICASNAGLLGTVVPVWDKGNDRMGFIAPPAWYAFFRDLTSQFVSQNINRSLTCY